MTKPMTVNARNLSLTAAKAIELLDKENAAWGNKGPNDLTKAVVEALNSSVEAAHAGNIPESANQTVRAVAAALLLSAGMHLIATHMHPSAPGVH